MGHSNKDRYTTKAFGAVGYLCYMSHPWWLCMANTASGLQTVPHHPPTTTTTTTTITTTTAMASTTTTSNNDECGDG